MIDFYNNIESGIRELVFILRNNGFNTDFSCAHEMWIKIKIKHISELSRLNKLLIEININDFIIDHRIYYENKILKDEYLILKLKKENNTFHYEKEASMFYNEFLKN